MIMGSWMKLILEIDAWRELIELATELSFQAYRIVGNRFHDVYLAGILVFKAWVLLRAFRYIAV